MWKKKKSSWLNVGNNHLIFFLLFYAGKKKYTGNAKKLLEKKIKKFHV